MDLNLIRVDCRLIHGQILEGWLPKTKADCLVVANDDVANDDIRKKIMEMAVPENIEVSFLSISETAATLMKRDLGDKRVMVLLSNCQDALKLFSHGLKFNRLNLGNLHFSPNKKQVTFTISLDGLDLKCLKKLADQGVEIEAQSSPNDTPRGYVEIMELVKKH